MLRDRNETRDPCWIAMLRDRIQRGTRIARDGIAVKPHPRPLRPCNPGVRIRLGMPTKRAGYRLIRFPCAHYSTFRGGVNGFPRPWAIFLLGTWAELGAAGMRKSGFKGPTAGSSMGAASHGAGMPPGGCAVV